MNSNIEFIGYTHEVRHGYILDYVFCRKKDLHHVCSLLSESYLGYRVQDGGDGHTWHHAYYKICGKNSVGHHLPFQHNELIHLPYMAVADISLRISLRVRPEEPFLLLKYILTLALILFSYCPVSWGCRIHWLHLCRGVRPPQRVSWIWL